MNEKNEAKKTKKRKKSRSSYMLLYIALGLSAVITLITLSLTVFFPIKNVEVLGKSIYSLSEIKECADIRLNSNLFTSDLSKVESNITKSLPYISSVKVERNFPSTIVLTVQKAEEYVQVESNGKYAITEKNMKCLKINDKATKGIPIVRGSETNKIKLGETVTFKTEKTDVLRLINDIVIGAKNSKLSLTVINVSNTQNLWATHDNKIVLLFGSDTNIAKKYSYASAALEQRKNNSEQGTLNLSRIPNSKNQVGFLPGELNNEQIAEF